MGNLDLNLGTHISWRLTFLRRVSWSWCRRRSWEVGAGRWRRRRWSFRRPLDEEVKPASRTCLGWEQKYFQMTFFSIRDFSQRITNPNLPQFVKYNTTLINSNICISRCDQTAMVAQSIKRPGLRSLKRGAINLTWVLFPVAPKEVGNILSAPSIRRSKSKGAVWEGK